LIVHLCLIVAGGYVFTLAPQLRLFGFAFTQDGMSAGLGFAPNGAAVEVRAVSFVLFSYHFLSILCTRHG